MKWVSRKDRKIDDIVNLKKDNNVGCGLINGDIVEIDGIGRGKLEGIYYTGGPNVYIKDKNYWPTKVKLIKKL